MTSRRGRAGAAARGEARLSPLRARPGRPARRPPAPDAADPPCAAPAPAPCAGRGAAAVGERAEGCGRMGG